MSKRSSDPAEQSHASATAEAATVEAGAAPYTEAPGSSTRRGTGAVWVSGALLMLAQSSQSLIFGGLALFLPIIRDDVGLTFSQAGGLAAISTGVYALMQIPSGYLTDRLGSKRLYIVGLVAVNILGVSFAQMHSFVLMAGNQALSGFFRSLVFAPGMLLMLRHFPERRRSTAIGVYVAGGVSSNIFLNAVGPFLVGPLGWRTLFEVFSIIGLLVTLAYWIFGIREPKRIGHPPPLRAVIDLFKLRAMWIVGGIQYIRLAVAYGVAVWLPTYLVVDKQYSLEVAGLLVAISAATTAPANFVGGYLGDRLKDETRIISVALASLAVTLVVLVQVHDLALLVAVAAVQGVFVQLYFGPLFAIPVKFLGPRTAGGATGFGNFFANIGGFTFAYTIGAIKDATGSFAVGLYALSALCIVGLVLAWWLSRIIRETQSTAAA